MARPLKSRKIVAPKVHVPRHLRSVTPLIYYGGKSRDSEWIVNDFPPHNTFVDVFGGGGAITFAKVPSVIDVYNDIGNVSNFMRVLRDYGDELYDALYHTPWSRQEFYNCMAKWSEISNEIIRLTSVSSVPFSAAIDINSELAVEWARCWYVTIIQGYSHEEKESSWKVAKSVDTARSWTTHVEELPNFSAKLRKVVIECLDFARVIKLYDKHDTLFYCDPPYTPGSRVSNGNYMHEMPVARHTELLDLLCAIKGQAVVSMYSDNLYEEKLSGWRRKEVTHLSSIQNSSSLDGRGTRTEVLWIKEREHGLWSQQESSPVLP